jgi:hypothetical protein
MGLIRNYTPFDGGFVLKLTRVDEPINNNPMVLFRIDVSAIELDKPFVKGDKIRSVKVLNPDGNTSLTFENGDTALFSGAVIGCQPINGSRHGLTIYTAFVDTNSQSFIFYHEAKPAFIHAYS